MDKLISNSFIPDTPPPFVESGDEVNVYVILLQIGLIHSKFSVPELKRSKPQAKKVLGSIIKTTPKMKKGAREMAKLRSLLRKHDMDLASDEGEDFNEFIDQVGEVTEEDYRAMLKEHRDRMKLRMRAKLGKKRLSKKVFFSSLGVSNLFKLFGKDEDSSASDGRSDRRRKLHAHLMRKMKMEGEEEEKPKAKRRKTEDDSISALFPSPVSSPTRSSPSLAFLNKDRGDGKRQIRKTKTMDMYSTQWPKKDTQDAVEEEAIIEESAEDKQAGEGDTETLKKKKIRKKAHKTQELEALEETFEKKWLTVVKHVPKRQRIISTIHVTHVQNAKKTVLLCQKEVRKKALKYAKTARDFAIRAKRLVKEVCKIACIHRVTLLLQTAVYWRKWEKEEKERQKRADKEIVIQRKKEEELREIKRQQRKLNFLLTQTELYTHFIGGKLRTDGQPTAEQVTYKLIHFMLSPFSASNAYPRTYCDSR